jgi:hypothetical protein
MKTPILNLIHFIKRNNRTIETKKSSVWHGLRGIVIVLQTIH